jgi:hypothetical protein
MNETQRKQAALEMIAFDHQRLIRQAEVNEQPMLPYLLGLALAEARESLEK